MTATVLYNGFRTSKDIDKLRDGTPITAVGLVIRRQRPHSEVVFITLEDEFGCIPCMVFGKTYRRSEYTLRSPFLIIKGRLAHLEGTCMWLSIRRSRLMFFYVPTSKNVGVEWPDRKRLHPFTSAKRYN
jgi:DNA polymerase III alpha subunit